MRRRVFLASIGVCVHLVASLGGHVSFGRHVRRNVYCVWRDYHHLYRVGPC